MASDSDADQDDNLATPTAPDNEPSTPSRPEAPSVHEESDDEDEENDGLGDEPKLKYTRLTGHLGAVYRSGDSTSSFMVAGDKMVWPAQYSNRIAADYRAMQEYVLINAGDWDTQRQYCK
jgi:hypothetical protein